PERGGTMGLRRLSSGCLPVGLDVKHAGRGGQSGGAAFHDPDHLFQTLRQDREKEKKAGPSGEGRKPGRLILSRNKADFLRSPLFCMKKIFCLHTNPGKQLPAGRAADWLNGKWRKSGFSKAGGKNSA